MLHLIIKHGVRLELVKHKCCMHKIKSLNIDLFVTWIIIYFTQDQTFKSLNKKNKSKENYFDCVLVWLVANYGFGLLMFW